jgi:hypothetical protein
VGQAEINRFASLGLSSIIRKKYSPVNAGKLLEKGLLNVLNSGIL